MKRTTSKVEKRSTPGNKADGLLETGKNSGAELQESRLHDVSGGVVPTGVEEKITLKD